MSAENIFGAMEAGDWEMAKEILAATSWTPVDLEKKHGVRKELLMI